MATLYGRGQEAVGLGVRPAPGQASVPAKAPARPGVGPHNEPATPDGIEILPGPAG